MDIIELLKAVVIGVVEGVTEWLPISSTGHMILVDEFIHLEVSPAFRELFLVVIQLGAISAVLILYFHRLNPFSRHKTSNERRGTLRLWAKVLVACLPAAVVGILLDDWAEAHFYNAWTVAIALMFYGIAFIVVERVQDRERSIGAHSRQAQQTVSIAETQAANTPGRQLGPGRSPRLLPLETPDSTADISFGRALGIGAFQCLAIIPGTSRSGSTILGGLILGVCRQTATEFSFFLAIPVMFGWSLLKTVKILLLDRLELTATETGVLVVGIVVAFVVSSRHQVPDRLH